jgi:hypothetical protein
LQHKPDDEASQAILRDALGEALNTRQSFRRRFARLVDKAAAAVAEASQPTLARPPKASGLASGGGRRLPGGPARLRQWQRTRHSQRRRLPSRLRAWRFRGGRRWQPPAPPTSTSTQPSSSCTNVSSWPPRRAK